MKRNLLLIFFLCFYIHTFGQTDSIIIFVDSINNYSIINTSTYNRKRIATSNNDNTKEIKSREGKLIANYNDNYFMTEGVEHCLKIAMNSWERYLNITNPIRFDVTINENLADDIEIKTEVRLCQDRTDRIAYPHSLYNQLKGKNNKAGTIDINAFIDWDASWIYDLNISGSDNLTTALMRHIAHLLGFGTSIIERTRGLGFAIRNFATPFDQLVSNGNTHLSTLVRATSTEIESFMKSNLFIDLGNADYPLFCSSDSFIAHRTGCYFSLETTNLMNYPNINKTELLGINNETLEVLENIGWNINSYKTKICGTDIDSLGYGSKYISHVFRAYNENGHAIDNISWNLQLYRDSIYETIQASTGNDFTLQPNTLSNGLYDEYGCLECRVVANVSEDGINKQYSLPLSLEARPHLLNFSILNIEEIPNSNYYNFDIHISSLGASSGYLTISNDYGAAIYYDIDSPNEKTISVTNALKNGPTYIDLALENEHGTTLKRECFEFNNLSMVSNCNTDSDELKKNISKKGTEEKLILRDCSNCHLQIIDTEFIEEGHKSSDYVFKWEMYLQGNHGKESSISLSDITAEKSIHFTISPKLLEYLPYEKDNYKKTDENRIVYHEGYIDCNVYEKATSDLVKIYRKYFRLEILPKVPIFRLLKYDIVDNNTNWSYPILKIELTNHGNQGAWLLIDQNEPNIPEVSQLLLDSIQDTPIIIETEGLTPNDSYRLESQNNYGSTFTDIIYLQPSSIEIPNHDVKITIKDEFCYINNNYNMLPIKIVGANGHVYYNDKKQTACIRLPQGIYIVNITDKNNSKTHKIIVK